jgi:hypothetical protein
MASPTDDSEAFEPLRELLDQHPASAEVNLAVPHHAVAPLASEMLTLAMDDCGSPSMPALFVADGSEAVVLKGAIAA